MSKNNNIDPRFANLILESMADGVFALNGQGQIILWNPSMEKITGYTAKETIGKKCNILNFNHCFGKKCPSGFEECDLYNYEKVDSRECILRHKDGYDVPVLKNARVVKDENHSVIGIVETLTDLTELKQTRQKIEEATCRLEKMYKLDNIIGKSRAIRKVFTAIKAAAPSDVTVLIQGESGTGKELVASAIHYNSERSKMPLITVNCSALSESLLESELFGHVKGAFTGATRDRVGRFEEAEEGTIFLDEIGEISPFIQIKLLRVLQEREIERVGESKKRKIDIRVIAATNKDLYTLVKQKKFREDLYYRLKVFPINIPLLKQRKEDIPLLVKYFIDIQNKKTGKKIKGFSTSAIRRLMEYEWPGNVRELENAIEHAFVLCSNNLIDIIDLPTEIRQSDSQSSIFIKSNRNLKTKQKLSKEMLLDLLNQCNWNKAEVARQVNLSRTAIWKYMKKWDIPLKPPQKLL